MSDRQSKLDLTMNEIGFYVCSMLGHAFTQKNLIKMVMGYRNFRNSIMIVFDQNKSQFGLNPLKCFRLSQSAIDLLKLNDIMNLSEAVIHEKVREYRLDISGFFEELEMKIHRSHLL